MSRWERILLVLGVCLPVPVLAATGLSIPLPATVERLAAGLVPFAEAATLAQDDASTRGPRGVIVRIPGEAAGEGGSDAEPSRVEPGSSDRASAPARGSRPDKKRSTPTAPTGGGLKDDPSAPDTPASSSDPKPTPGEGDGTSGVSPPPPPPQAQPEPQPQPQPEPQPQPQPEPLPLPLPIKLPPPPPLLPSPLPELGK